MRSSLGCRSSSSSSFFQFCGSFVGDCTCQNILYFISLLVPMARPSLYPQTPTASCFPRYYVLHPSRSSSLMSCLSSASQFPASSTSLPCIRSWAALYSLRFQLCSRYVSYLAVGVFPDLFVISYSVGRLCTLSDWLNSPSSQSAL